MLGAIIMLSGCSGGSSGPESNTGVLSSSTGVLSLGVSDAPVQDARQVCIEFAEAEFKKAQAAHKVAKDSLVEFNNGYGRVLEVLE